MYSGWKKYSLPFLSNDEQPVNTWVPRIGINGFGRVGRQLLRAANKHGLVNVVAINDPYMSPEYMMYLLKYDSTQHGASPHIIETGDGLLYVDSAPISVFNCHSPDEIPWDEAQADYIVECTGIFISEESGLLHLTEDRARKVIISGASATAPNFVMGVNHRFYRSHMLVVSNSGSTVNCLAPLAKIINDSHGIMEGVVTSIHAVTADDKTVDGPNDDDWRAGRSAFQNIAPTFTDVAKTLGKVIPCLSGKLSALNFRVPIPNVSVVDFTCKLLSPSSYERIIELFTEASYSLQFQDIISVCDDPIVSSDVCGDSHSCIVDVGAGMALNDTFMKLVAWYDNEWAYSNRLIDLICYMKSIDEADDS